MPWVGFGTFKSEPGTVTEQAVAWALEIGYRHVDTAAFYGNEADVGRVNEGQPATFTVDAYPNHLFQARIAQVRYGSKTVSGVVTYETVLSLDNADLSLRPGMTATAVITVKRVENCLLVPNAALRFAPATGQEQAPAAVR